MIHDRGDEYLTNTPLESLVQEITAGQLKIKIVEVFNLEQVVETHPRLSSNERNASNWRLLQDSEGTLPVTACRAKRENGGLGEDPLGITMTYWFWGEHQERSLTTKAERTSFTFDFSLISYYLVVLLPSFLVFSDANVAESLCVDLTPS